MLIVGSVHKRIGSYLSAIEGVDRSIQVGNLVCDDPSLASFVPPGHRWIRGSGDCSYNTRSGDRVDGILCLGDDLLDLTSVGPADIVVSHSSPLICGDKMSWGSYRERPVEVLLQQHFDTWRPSLWIFGNWNQHRAFYIGGCEFHCLGALREPLLTMELEYD